MIQRVYKLWSPKDGAFLLSAGRLGVRGRGKVWYSSGPLRLMLRFWHPYRTRAHEVVAYDLVEVGRATAEDFLDKKVEL